jgi:hypothetical protein
VAKAAHLFVFMGQPDTWSMAGTMHADRLAGISAVAGSATWGLFVLANMLLAANPPAAGHQSAFYSAAGVILFAMSGVGFVLGPTALITGVKALRRVGADAPRAVTIAAWVGVATGGAYTLVLCVPLIVIPWLLLQ